MHACTEDGKRCSRRPYVLRQLVFASEQLGQGGLDFVRGCFSLFQLAHDIALV
jgi:hypothetical protein